MAQDPHRAFIVGGGIAGLAAAYWLDQIGWQCIIVERSATMRQGRYRIVLSGSGLETLGRMGLIDELRKISLPADESIFRDRKGQEVARTRHRDFHKGSPFLVVERADLVRVLEKAMPSNATVQVGTTVSRWNDNGDKVSGFLSNGAPFCVDLMIAADGFRSTIRESIFPDQNNYLQDLGYYVALYDVGKIENDSESTTGSYETYVEPGHLVYYSMDREGATMATHIWRDNTIGLEASPSPAVTLKRISARSNPKVREMLRRAEATESVLKIDTLTLVVLPQWSAGRVILVGDAAHCMTLISGQGACMSLTSVEALSQALKNNETVPEALQDHEARTRPSIDRLQAYSRRTALEFVPSGTCTFHVRNFLFRNLSGAVLGRYYTRALRKA